MPDITIPEAAVEAAARNMFDLRATEPDQSGDEWDDLPESWREEWRDGARAALTAAAPHIAARALRDAADELQNAYPAATRRLREIEARHRNEVRNG